MEERFVTLLSVSEALSVSYRMLSHTLSLTHGPKIQRKVGVGYPLEDTIEHLRKILPELNERQELAIRKAAFASNEETKNQTKLGNING